MKKHHFFHISENEVFIYHVEKQIFDEKYKTYGIENLKEEKFKAEAIIYESEHRYAQYYPNSMAYLSTLIAFCSLFFVVDVTITKAINNIYWMVITTLIVIDIGIICLVNQLRKSRTINIIKKEKLNIMCIEERMEELKRHK